MPVTVEEKDGSREGDVSESELLFVVAGTDSDTEAREALADEAPATHGDLVVDINSYHVSPKRITGDGDGIWEGRVKYVTLNSATPEAGDSEFSFDTSGGTQHITQAKAHVASYGTSAPDHKGAIGVTHNTVEGVDIIAPEFRFQRTLYVSNDDMTVEYIRTLFTTTGRYNDGAWTCNVDGLDIAFSDGEVLLLGVTGSKRKRENDWQITQRFAGSPGITTAVTIATGIVVSSKKGWDYLWVEYQDGDDGTSPVKTPRAAHVERVYDAADFDALVPV